MAKVSAAGCVTMVLVALATGLVAGLLLAQYWGICG